MFSSADLPTSIYSSIAVLAFGSQREGLLNLARNCLPSLTNSLQGQSLISQEVFEKASNKYVEESRRCLDLLNSIEERIKAVPSDFIKFVRVLEADTYLEPLATQLVHSYDCK